MWLNLLFNIIFPLVSLVILNTAIYKKLNQMNPPSREVSVRRSTEMRLRKREQRLGKISLLIVLIFIICHSLKNIPTIFEIFGKDPRVS